MILKFIILILGYHCMLAGFSFGNTSPSIFIGSKSFTEGRILAEIVAQKMEASGREVKIIRRFDLGGTGIIFQSLRYGQIDLYPEYTGTLFQTIFQRQATNMNADGDDLEKLLRQYALSASAPLGFNNSYALGMRKDLARKLNIRKISDLKNKARLRMGISSEFAQRKDGLFPLMQFYGLPTRPSSVTVMEHALAYEALQTRKVDIIDIYTTDARIKENDLIILEDDRHFFPPYEAIILVKSEFVRQYPELWRSINELKGTLSNEIMQELNYKVEVQKYPIQEVAKSFLYKDLTKKKEFNISPSQVQTVQWTKIWMATKEHSYLVFMSLLFSILVGIPLGIVARSHKLLGQIILTISGVIQTIPSLALLCFFIPFFGIGTYPALIALSLYGLFPIIRGMYTGLINIDPKLLEISTALGLSKLESLMLVEIPLASVALMNGIKTSSIISVGTATLAAFIGGGGYGSIIISGLTLNDQSLILQGAIPAALMSLCMHFIFEYLDKLIIPKGLQ